MSPVAITLAAVFLAITQSAQEPLIFQQDLGGSTATLQIAAEPAVAEAAAKASFEAMAEVSAEAGGAFCDAAVSAARTAGAGAILATFRGAIAAGDPPPNTPGWMVRLGFSTPGYRTAVLPLAQSGVGRVASSDELLKIAVTAQNAVEAERLAKEVRRLGRRDGRALIERTPGTRLFLEDARFKTLFDGRSLGGWTEKGGRYDGEAVWTASKGNIVGRTGPNGEGGLLYTEDDYSSFVLELETKIDHPFDSGVFVHMVPREIDLKGAQVTLDYRDGGEIAGIYSDGWLQNNKSVKERFREGWNHIEVRVTGFEFRIEVWLNGDKVTDYQLPADAKGFASSGKIGVQVHGGNPGEKEARFRNIRIRELPVFGDEQPDTEGWEDLFNGEDLDGWEKHGVQEGYRVVEGELLFPAEGGGHIATTEDFKDFRLRLDFKTARMANSGLFLRAARDGSNPAFSGCEVQILDDFNWEATTNSTLKPWQFCGSLYGSVAPGQRALNPIGEWNTYEVLYRGSRLALALNGKLLYDVDTHALTPESGAPFAERAGEGFIGLQVHSPGADFEGDTALWFRNVEIQRL